MFGASGPLHRSKTQRLFPLSAGFLTERLPVAVAAESTLLIPRSTRAAGSDEGRTSPAAR